MDSQHNGMTSFQAHDLVVAIKSFYTRSEESYVLAETQRSHSHEHEFDVKVTIKFNESTYDLRLTQLTPASSVYAFIKTIRRCHIDSVRVGREQAINTLCSKMHMVVQGTENERDQI
jgi:hypothetical protein